jgi:hypothetical protein
MQLIFGKCYNLNCKPPKHFLIPQFISIKKSDTQREIILVWGDSNPKKTTKAVLQDGDPYDFELGFYLAYYKQVHSYCSFERISKDIADIYKQYKNKQDAIKEHLKAVFYDNCLLGYANATRFLKYITNRQAQDTITIPQNFITETRKGAEQK